MKKAPKKCRSPDDFLRYWLEKAFGDPLRPKNGYIKNELFSVQKKQI